MMGVHAARTAVALAVLASSSLLACADASLTQISITIDDDPDFDPPLEYVELVITTGDDITLAPAFARNLDDEAHKLPRRLTLVRDREVIEPLRLTTRGYRGDAPVIEHKTDVLFKTGELWQLPIKLSPSCEDIWKTCAAEETCEADRGCQPIMTRSSSRPSAPLESGDGGAAGTVVPDGVAVPTAAEPTCRVDRPLPNQKLFVGDDLKLEGACVDAAKKPIEDGVSWISDLDGVLATRSSQKIKTGQLEPGMRALILCAVDAQGRIGCSPSVPVNLEGKPAPPEAEIISVQQEGVEGRGPFSSARPIEFMCSSVGAGLSLQWRDNFIADFGQERYANMSAPRVGRHRVTLSAVDEANQSVMPPPTVAFDVIEASRFEAGQRTLIQPFARVNDALEDSGARAVVALASDARGLVFASTTRQVYVFDGSDPEASADPAVVDMEGSESVALPEVRAIAIDGRGSDSRIYFGTSEGVRVCRYTPGETPIAEDTCSDYAGDQEELTREAVTSIARLELADRDLVAVGTEAGLWIAQDDDGVARDAVRVPGIEEAIIGVVASNATFWFSTPSSGLYRYDPIAGSIPELTSSGAPPPPLSAVVADLGDGIWLGSEDTGLRRLEPNGVWQSQWPRGEPFEGLASDRIQALVPAMGVSMGRRVPMLWVGTDRGMTRLDYLMISFITLDEEAGLPSNDVRSFTVLAESDHLVIGTSEGVALYDGS